MSPDQTQHQSGWTLETLKVHIDQRFTDNDRALQAALASAKEAVLVAEKNAEKWRDNANEWRAAMTDRERNFASSKSLSDIEQRMDKMEGASNGMKAAYGYLLAGIAAVSTLIAIVMSLKK